jgi:hypothetical protein
MAKKSPNPKEGEDEKRDVGRPKIASVLSLSYNNTYLDILNKNHAMLDGTFRFCVFDDHRARGSLDGHDSVRMMVNTSYIQEFQGGDRDAKTFLEALRKKIYGKSREGGGAETNLKSGSLNQETYQLNWRKIFHKEKFLILWYTTTLKQEEQYVPSMNFTEIKEQDTDITPVAFPAGYHASEFGNDFYCVKKRFKTHQDMTKDVVSLRPPLDSAGEFGTGSGKKSDFLTEAEADALASSDTEDEADADDVESSEDEDEADANASKMFGPESEMGLISEGIKMGKEMIKGAMKKPSSNMPSSNLQGMNRAEREKKFKQYKLAAAKHRDRLMDGPVLVHALKQHGYAAPPPHGYGTRSTDRPEAQQRVIDNENAVRKLFQQHKNKLYDHDNPASRSWVGEMGKRAAAAYGSAYTSAGKAVVNGAVSVGSAVGRAAKGTGSLIASAIVGEGEEEPSKNPGFMQMDQKLRPDRFVKVASDYTLHNTSSNNGFAGLFDGIADKEVKNAFRTIAGTNEKWNAYCQIIVSNNNWSPSNENCLNGLDGMRQTIQNESGH